jgi:hypothetical protein
MMEHLNIDIHHHAEIQFPAFEWFDRTQLMQDLMTILAFYSLTFFALVLMYSFLMIQKTLLLIKTGKSVDITIDIDRSN